MFIDREIFPETYRRVADIAECRPEVRALHDIWQRMRGGRGLPSRRDFDPVEVPQLLSRMFLIDVLPGASPERRYRVRLKGTELVVLLGRDWTGRFLHEFSDLEAADHLVAVADHVVASRMPFISSGLFYRARDRSTCQSESILLPLAEDDGDVNMIMGVTIVF